DLPMAAIEDVRLGAMLRVILPPRGSNGRPVVITAWNAPGVGKDRPRDRLASSSVHSRYGQDHAHHTAPSPWSERLVRDQRASPSHAVVQAWEQHRSADAGGVGEPSRRLNSVVLIVLVISVLLPAARILAENRRQGKPRRGRCAHHTRRGPVTRGGPGPTAAAIGSRRA